MKTDDRYERGLKKIKEIYGDAWDIGFLDDISPEFGRYTVDFLFGDIYNLKTLDARAREIAIIASLDFGKCQYTSKDPYSWCA